LPPGMILNPSRACVEAAFYRLGIKAIPVWPVLEKGWHMVFAMAHAKKQTGHFSDPGKEAAIIGSIVVGSFEQIPNHCLVPQEAFVDPKWRIIYGVSLKIREGRDGVVCVESINDFITMHDLDREMQTAVDSTKTMIWQRWYEFADTSLAYALTTRPLEYCLSEIAALYVKRRTAEIAERLASGELEMAQARKEFEALWQSANGASFPSGVSLWDYVGKPIDPEDTLFGNRFLCRKGMAMFVGPSGVGKSSIAVQGAAHWAAGLPFLNIKPARPLRIGIFGCEDDEGDCIEFMTDLAKEAGFTPEQIELVKQNSFYYHWTKSSGNDFLYSVVDPVIARDKLDLVILNPLQGYLGDSIQNTEVTNQFIRHGLLPIIEKHDCAALIFHHTPKTNYRTTEGWTASDWMYAGAGAADITNAMRAILVQEPTGKTGVYKLIGAKRGYRLGWVDEFSREARTEQYISWGSNGTIWWKLADEDEIAGCEKPKSKKEAPLEEVVKLVPKDGILKEIRDNDRVLTGGLTRAIMNKFAIGERTARDRINELCARNEVHQVDVPREGKKPAKLVKRGPKPEEEQEDRPTDDANSASNSDINDEIPY